VGFKLSKKYTGQIFALPTVKKGAKENDQHFENRMSQEVEFPPPKDGVHYSYSS
jgi:hypothetical protein